MLYYSKKSLLQLRGKSADEIDKIQRAVASKSPSVKTVVLIMGIVYLFVAGVGITWAVRSSSPLAVFKYVVLILLDIAGVTLLYLNRKQFAWICIGAFLVLNCSTTFLTL